VQSSNTIKNFSADVLRHVTDVATQCFTTSNKLISFTVAYTGSPLYGCTESLRIIHYNAIFVEKAKLKNTHVIHKLIAVTTI